jgi:hypothetical protein
LCRDVWSKMIEMTQVVLAQNESCAGGEREHRARGQQRSS